MSQYAKSGVDIKRGYEVVSKIGNIVESTYDRNVLSDMSSFGSLYDQGNGNILVSGTDGIGSKLLLAINSNKYDTIGIDAVGMCVNDVLVSGAKPLFFLDYLAVHKIDSDIISQIVQSVADGCIQANCALVGGETAEMPDLYAPNHFDLAGFCVGSVAKEQLITGNNVTADKVVLGINSSGLHSNGFSLVRQIFFKDNDFAYDHQFPELDCPLIDELLKPTAIYVKPVLAVLANYQVHSMAHITGGGFYENIVRCLPDNIGVEFDRSKLTIPPIFKLIQTLGEIEETEMFNTFNMGTGFTLVVDRKDSDSIQTVINSFGFTCSEIGITTEVSDENSRISFR